MKIIKFGNMAPFEIHLVVFREIFKNRSTVIVVDCTVVIIYNGSFIKGYLKTDDWHLQVSVVRHRNETKKIYIIMKLSNKNTVFFVCSRIGD